VITNHDDRGDGGSLKEIPTPYDDIVVASSTSSQDGGLHGVEVYDEIMFVVDWAPNGEEFESSWLD
jgi:hypothetical protein